jgi:hypothetical protein
MLRTTGPAAKPDIQRVVDGILREDSNFDRNENRSAHRENLVRAVKMEVRDPEATIQAFSRNISATGIGVITGEQVVGSSIAVLEIASLNGENIRVLAECRWSKAYGDGWFLSGWQFISLKR